MWWIVVHTDHYGEHVSVDSSKEYARALYKRLADDENVYTVELYRAALESQIWK